MYGGKTVEVLNTDAEGRLVLADALAGGAEDTPDAIVDVATLTGAQVLALGNRTVGVMANDDAFRDAVRRRRRARPARRSGRCRCPRSCARAWTPPSPTSRTWASGSAACSSPGCSCRSSCGEGIAWAHLDIAGPAFNEAGPVGYTPKGGTGVGVRTLVRLAETSPARRPATRTAPGRPRPARGTGPSCGRGASAAVRRDICGPPSALWAP